MSKAGGALLSIAVLLLVCTAGCGYHTAGKANTLPTHINVLAVPTFVNHTHSYRVEQVFTSAVIRELTTRTQYKIVDEKNDGTDAILHADITQASSAPLTYDSQTGRATSGLITVTIQVSLVNNKGTVLFSNPNYTFREEYEITQEVSSFFDEESPALERMSRDMARSLVSNILEGF
ncbi:MAG TPA: LPS assembly lipoprotein LptE [Terriglobales bacterium]|nr:LPS assembly lipoprotein LptE [Terriglobales bacterium]